MIFVLLTNHSNGKKIHIVSVPTLQYTENKNETHPAAPKTQKGRVNHYVSICKLTFMLMNDPDHLKGRLYFGTTINI